MDEIAKRFARELAQGIAAVVVGDPRLEACRARARAAGFDLDVSVEALLGAIAIHPLREIGKDGGPASSSPRPTGAPARQTSTLGMTTSDRRFLKSLRIVADDKAREQV